MTHDSKILQGSIEEKSSNVRKEILQKLLDEVLFPQRLRLLNSRDFTWQSAFFDSDGYVAEMISAIVLGVPGLSRRGVTRSFGDLKDETEVKKGFRADPNIDFFLTGFVSQNGKAIKVVKIPEALKVPEVYNQMNANACSVQLLIEHKNSILGLDLYSTPSKDCFSLTNDGTATIKLKNQIFDRGLWGNSVNFCVRQERGHINFGNKSRGQLQEMLVRKPVMVFYGHNLNGGLQIVGVRSGLENKAIEKYLDRIFEGSKKETKKQVQPYLYPDNVRDSLYESELHSVATAMQAKLLLVVNEKYNGIAIDYWDPNGNQSVLNTSEVLFTRHSTNDAPDMGIYLRKNQNLKDLSIHERTDWFFQECMADFYRKLAPYCDLTSTTRNIGFGNLAQHLISHTSGIRGTRSGARGADLLEPDGQPSEIKLATGEKEGDFMGTEDMPRLTLGWDIKKMKSWKRLFAVRIVDQGEGLRALAHAPTEETMEKFREQAENYFEGRVNNGSGGLQYHAVDLFPHDNYGTRERSLSFVRVADLWEGKESKFPFEVPQF